MECRVDLRIGLSMSVATAVALSFVLQEKLHTAPGRSLLAHFLAVDHHETPDTGLRTKAFRVADGTNMVLLEEHGHSKVGVDEFFSAERRTPEIDEPIRPSFRLAAE